MKIYWCSS